MPADVQLDEKIFPGSLQTPATSDCDLSPQPASGFKDAQIPTQAAPATATKADKDEQLPCSRLNRHQLLSVSQAAGNALGWAKAKMHTMAIQGRNRRNAAGLEQAERHRRELQSLLATLDQGLSNCNAVVMSMEKWPPEVASRIPEYLRTGNEALEPLQVQQCDAAWQAAQRYLQAVSTMISRSSSDRTKYILTFLRREMCWIKTEIGHLQPAIKFMLEFERNLSKAAGRCTPADNSASPADACPSPAEYESQLQRSTAAAAALPEQDEAEKTAAKLDLAKAGKKTKAGKKQHRARSAAAQKGVDGDAASASEHTPQPFASSAICIPLPVCTSYMLQVKIKEQQLPGPGGLPNTEVQLGAAALDRCNANTNCIHQLAACQFAAASPGHHAGHPGRHGHHIDLKLEASSNILWLPAINTDTWT